MCVTPTHIHKLDVDMLLNAIRYTTFAIAQKTDTQRIKEEIKKEKKKKTEYSRD